MKTLQYLFQETQINFLLNGTDQNVMINATEMAKAFGKRTDHYLQNESTKELLKALKDNSQQAPNGVHSESKTTSQLTPNGVNSISQPWGIPHRSESNSSNNSVKNGDKVPDISGTLESKIIDNRGRNGIFFCEELAIDFAAWLDVQFKVWIYRQIKEITFGNYAKHWDAHARAESLKLDIAKLKEDFLNNGASKEEMALYFDKEKSLKQATNEKTAAIKNQLNLFKDL